MLDDVIRKIFPGFARAASYEPKKIPIYVRGALRGGGSNINGRPVPVRLRAEGVATYYSRSGIASA